MLVFSSSCPAVLKAECLKISEAGHQDFDRLFKTQDTFLRNEDSLVELVLNNGRFFVKKTYFKHCLSPLRVSQIRREVEIHCTVAHKFIAECYLAYELPDRISLLIEYITGGDLFKEVYGKGLPERRAAARVIGPLLEALAYLHSCGLYHRDIKLENVLQCEGGIKLCDFGLAIDSLVERPVTRLGTTDYFSPEILRAKHKLFPDQFKDREDVAYGPEVDIWALGVLTYELLCGQGPFQLSELSSTQEMLVALEEGPSIGFPSFLSTEAVDFIRRALEFDRTKRATASELLAHPWIKRNQIAMKAITRTADASNAPREKGDPLLVAPRGNSIAPSKSAASLVSLASLSPSAGDRSMRGRLALQALSATSSPAVTVHGGSAHSSVAAAKRAPGPSTEASRSSRGSPAASAALDSRCNSPRMQGSTFMNPSAVHGAVAAVKSRRASKLMAVTNATSLSPGFNINASMPDLRAPLGPPAVATPNMNSAPTGRHSRSMELPRGCEAVPLPTPPTPLLRSVVSPTAALSQPQIRTTPSQRLPTSHSAGLLSSFSTLFKRKKGSVIPQVHSDNALNASLMEDRAVRGGNAFAMHSHSTERAATPQDVCVEAIHTASEAREVSSPATALQLHLDNRLQQQSNSAPTQNYNGALAQSLAVSGYCTSDTVSHSAGRARSRMSLEVSSAVAHSGVDASHHGLRISLAPPGSMTSPNATIHGGVLHSAVTSPDSIGLSMKHLPAITGGSAGANAARDPLSPSPNHPHSAAAAPHSESKGINFMDYMRTRLQGTEPLPIPDPSAHDTTSRGSLHHSRRFSQSRMAASSTHAAQHVQPGPVTANQGGMGLGPR